MTDRKSGIEQAIQIYPMGRAIIIGDQLDQANHSLLQSTAGFVVDPTNGQPIKSGAQLAAEVAELDLVHFRVESTLLGSEGVRGYVTLCPGQYLVGRSQEADLINSDQLLSRLHAVINVHSGGRVTIRDLGSTNGTIFDGHLMFPDKAKDFEIGSVVEMAHLSIIRVDKVPPIPDPKGPCP